MSAIRLYGDTSGYTEIAAQSVAGNNSITLPLGGGTLVTSLSGTASTASFATTSFGLTGTPNITVGIATASSFVGNLTGTATGLSGSPNITVNNIVGVAATFSGNVSIAGTLTYEDVTNVDSIGLVTARSGAHVATVSGNLLVGTSSSTGTTSQPLQVTGGAYVSGNTGIGTTNPQQKLHISGISASGINTGGDILVDGGIIRNYEYTDYANLAPKLVVRRYNTSGVFTSFANNAEELTTGISTAPFVSQSLTSNIQGFTFSADYYSVEFVGFLYAATSGTYTFGVNSDDGSDLFIDGKLVAYWYGGHGTNVSGTPGGTQLSVYLNKGFHRLYTRFQEVAGGDSHEIVYKTPGSASFAVIPASVLYHHPSDLLAGFGDNLGVMSGNVGIATTNPTEKLHVIGNILASGNVTGYSDETLKDNIQTIPDALDKVIQLRGVEFDRKDIEGNPHNIGVIAQEVEKIIPEVVSTHEDGIKSVAYGNLVGLLIEAIKELKEEVNELKARLEEV